MISSENKVNFFAYAKLTLKTSIRIDGNKVSTQFMSFVNRLSIRPLELLWKNTILARVTQLKSISCKLTEMRKHIP